MSAKKVAIPKTGVSLYEAVGSMHLLLDEFAHDWRKRRQEDPDNYPSEYPTQAEWEDQFQAWLEIKDDLT